MKGDKSRETFQVQKRYRSVNLQQGRVQVDADWNELVEIVNYLRTTITADVLGQSAGLSAANGLAASVPVPAAANLTASNSGFGISIAPGPGDDLVIQSGRIYVDGIVCESSPTAGQYTFKSQPDLPPPTPASGAPDPLKLLPTLPGNYLVYLDVWHRDITAIEDPSIREVALGGPDTATRTQTVAQVRLLQIDGNATLPATAPSLASLTAFQALVNPPSLGSLVVSLAAPSAATSPCDVSGSGGFTGVQNQLYRVEIHSGGTLPASGTAAAPTFKWSRDNGSAVSAVASVSSSGGTGIVVLQSRPVDDVHGFAVGQWIELSDDTTDLQSSLQGNPKDNSNGNPLFFQLTAVNGASLTFANPANVGVPTFTDPSKHPKARRWDIASTPLVAAAGAVVPLEDGVQVKLQPGTYAAGDYWLIAARTGGGASSIEFPPGNMMTSQSAPSPATPRFGVRHHYAALALVNLVLSPQVSFGTKLFDYRKRLPGLTALTSDDITYSAANPQGQCNQLLQNIAPPGTLSPPTVTNFLEALCEKVTQVAAAQSTPSASQVVFTSTGPCGTLLNLAGASNVAAALDLLCTRVSGINPASIGALALTGGTLTGPLTLNPGSIQLTGDVNSTGGRVRDQKARVVVVATDVQTIAATTPTLITSMSMSVPIATVAGAPAGTTVPLQLRFQMQGVTGASLTTTASDLAFRLLVNGNQVAFAQERFLQPASLAEMRGVFLERLLFLVAGTYTVTVQWNAVTAGPTFTGCFNNTTRELSAVEL